MAVEIGNYRVSIWPLALLGLIIFSVARWRKTQHWPSLLLVIAFGLYVLVVMDKVFFPLQLTGTMAAEWRVAAHWSARINLIPFYSRFGFTTAHWVQFGQNLLMTVPMGLGLPFVTRVNKKHFFWLLLATGVGLELGQLLISLVLGFPYRVIDITDVVANTLGVFTGFALFKGFAWIFLRLSKSHNKKSGGVKDYIGATIARFN